MSELEHKFLGGSVTNSAKAERNGIPVGIVEGYIATWDIDKADRWGERDRFEKGAFTKSLEKLKASGEQIKLRDEHGRTVGGFPIESVREDETGLFGVAEINLAVQQGAELYALAKQGVKRHFSVGFHAERWEMNADNDLRTILQADVVEGSLVDVPRNDAAKVTDVKHEKGIKRITVTEVKGLCTKRDVENVLRESGAFSNDAATALAARFTEESQGEPDNTDIELKAALDQLDGMVTPASDTERELNNILEVLSDV